MPKILSTETSPFINQTSSIYTQNKVGQFSKYLDKNPIFVKYYHINTTLSRADAGLNSVKEEIGYNSPVRYNEIKEFPMYGFSDLKPDQVYDENGHDIEMDLSGITILPGTIRPIAGDHIYFRLPNMSVGMLWRVTNVEFVTVQANDFYQVDCELRCFPNDQDKQNTYNQLLKQVVEKYTCIFENIGTQDACIVRDDRLKQGQLLGDFINNFMSAYCDTFYNRDMGTFVAIGDWNGVQCYFYDLDMIHFMKRTGMWDQEMQGRPAIALVYDEIQPMNFEGTYRKLLWYALEKKSAQFMATYQYYEVSGIIKDTSPLKFFYPEGTSVGVRPFTMDVKMDETLSRRVTGWTRDYWPIELTEAIKLGKDMPYYDPRLNLILEYLSSGNTIHVNLDDLMGTDFTMSLYDYLTGAALIYVLMKIYSSVVSSEASGLNVVMTGGGLDESEAEVEAKETDKVISDYVRNTLIPEVAEQKEKLDQLENTKVASAFAASVKESAELCTLQGNATIRKLVIIPRGIVQASGYTLLYAGDVIFHEDVEFKAMDPQKADNVVIVEPHRAIKCEGDYPIIFEFDDYKSGVATVTLDYQYDKEVGQYATNELVNP